MKKLSRDEMKKVMGGVDASLGGYCGGSCVGSIGEWEYRPENATFMTCLNDVLTYCSSGQGQCRVNCGGGEAEI